MNIVKPYARLIVLNGETDLGGDNPGEPLGDSAGKRALRQIEFCGRISHRSEDAQTHDSFDRFIRAVVLQHGDWSIVEHVSATVDLFVDRGVQQELTRHRLAAYTIESTRFVNYDKKMPPVFIQPLTTDPNPDHASHVALDAWQCAMQQAEDSYKVMLSHGCTPQIARSVFPLALGSRIIMTCNLRNWRHLFIMRTTKETHPQMREVMIPLLRQFQAVIPILYEDIEPEARQVDNLKKAR